jgi:hypothetical protein
MAFEVSAHMTVRPGQLEGFRRQAAECIRITKEKYRHNKNILEARTRLFKDYADNHFMTVYGDPAPELVELVKAHHMEKQFKWFSFVKGLD